MDMRGTQAASDLETTASVTTDTLFRTVMSFRMQLLLSKETALL